MRVIVNDRKHDLSAGTLEAVLSALDYRAECVATALNGRFVPRSARADTPVAEGDRIEVVAPREGG